MVNANDTTIQRLFAGRYMENQRIGCQIDLGVKLIYKSEKEIINLLFTVLMRRVRPQQQSYKGTNQEVMSTSLDNIFQLEHGKQRYHICSIKQSYYQR